jgi:hypothetical protein
MCPHCTSRSQLLTHHHDDLLLPSLLLADQPQLMHTRVNMYDKCPSPHMCCQHNAPDTAQTVHLAKTTTQSVTTRCWQPHLVSWQPPVSFSLTGPTHTSSLHTTGLASSSCCPQAGTNSCPQLALCASTANMPALHHKGGTPVPQRTGQVPQCSHASFGWLQHCSEQVT